MAPSLAGHGLVVHISVSLLHLGISRASVCSEVDKWGMASQLVTPRCPENQKEKFNYSPNPSYISTLCNASSLEKATSSFFTFHYRLSHQGLQRKLPIRPPDSNVHSERAPALAFCSMNMTQFCQNFPLICKSNLSYSKT